MKVMILGVGSAYLDSDVSTDSDVSNDDSSNNDSSEVESGEDSSY